MILRFANQAGALLLKELQHHALALVGVGVLYLAMAVVVLMAQLNQQAGSVIETAANLGWFVIPMLCAFLARRLVVLEYQQQTHEFLTGLPSSALGRAVVKAAFGLVLVQIVVVLTTLSVALLASLQEITPILFVGQAIVQIGVYVWAWYAIAFLAAHLGRFRAVFWLLFFPGLVSISLIDERLTEELLFTASLAKPLDQARVFLPWRAIGLTTLWAAVLSVLGLMLAGLRGGAVVAGWFRPAEARERAVMVVVVLLGLFGLSYAEEVQWLGGPVYQQVPLVAGHGQVRVIGRSDSALAEQGRGLQARLDAITPHLREELPDVVLVTASGDPDEAVTLRTSEFRELVMEVDVDASPIHVQERALDLLMGWWNGYQLKRRPGLAWILTGGPVWWSATPEMERALALRAAWAASRLDGPSDLEDLRGIEVELGPDVARAVAWAGLEAAEAEGGDVDALLEAWLAIEGNDGLFNTVRMDRVSPDTWLSWQAGIEGEAHRRTWFDALKRLEEEHAGVLAGLPELRGTVEVAPGDEADVVVAVRLPEPPPDGLEVTWTTLPPLHDRPLRGSDWKRRPVREATERFPTSAPGHLQLGARCGLYVPELHGELGFGWTVR